jgi:hypothetical protein
MIDPVDVPSAGFLTLQYAPDPLAGYARLTVVANANGFGGRSSAWLAPQSIVDFAAELSAYPLDAARPPGLSGGYGADPKSGEGPVDTVRLEARPMGAYGQVGIEIYLSDRLAPMPNPRHEVRAQLLTSYERLQRFSKDLQAVAIGSSLEATLESDVLA